MGANEKFAFDHGVDAVLNGHAKQISDRGVQFVRSSSGSSRTSVQTVNHVPTWRPQLLMDSCALAWGHLAPHRVLYACRSVLVSADVGNFEEAAGWRTNVRPEPSFEEVLMFSDAAPAKAVTFLMRGSTAWGFFGVASITAIPGPYPIMQVSSQAAVQKQYVGARMCGLAWQQCLDAIVADDGAEVCTFSDQGLLGLMSD